MGCLGYSLVEMAFLVEQWGRRIWAGGDKSPWAEGDKFRAYVGSGRFLDRGC